MEECLKKGAEGRKHAVAIGRLPYSGDLANQLMEFSQKLESVYSKMQELRGSNNKIDPRKYAKFYAILDEKLAWFVRAEAGQQSL